LAGAPSSDGAPAVAVSKGAIGSREVRDNLLTR